MAPPVFSTKKTTLVTRKYSGSALDVEAFV